jgi:hypothetical protein
MSAAAPPPPPRRTRRACRNVARIGEASTCADSGRFGVRHVGMAVGGTALQGVLDGLVGAANEQRHGGSGGAVVRRPVQRCVPAGRRGIGAIIGARSPAADDAA